MEFYELGILIRGAPVVHIVIKDYFSKESNQVIKAALLSGLLRFAEVTMAPVDYLESSNLHIIFHRSLIFTEVKIYEPIITYAVIEKIRANETKKIEKKIKKEVQPILKWTSEHFIKKFEGKCMSEVKQFRPFAQQLKAYIQKGGKLTVEEFNSILN